MESVKRINVLYISNAPRILGGAEKSLIGLLQNLDRSRIRPFFASTCDLDLTAQMRNLGLDFFKLAAFRKENPFPFLLTAVKLARFIRAKRISLVHANRLPDAFYAILPAKLARVPLMIHHRDTSRFSALDRWLVAQAEWNVCISNWQNQNFLGGKGTLIPNGIDLRLFRRVVPQKGAPPAAPVIALLGRVTPIKGQRTFVDAAKLVLAEQPECRFVMAGETLTTADQMFKAQLEAEIHAAGLAQHIYFVGQVQDVAAFLQEVDISVVPSQREPFGRVIIESMAMERPVIASNIGGPLDIITPDTGLLVSPDQPSAFADAILKLLRDPDLRLAMGKCGRVHVRQHYTIQRTAEDIMDLYTSLFDQSQV